MGCDGLESTPDMNSLGARLRLFTAAFVLLLAALATLAVADHWRAAVIVTTVGVGLLVGAVGWVEAAGPEQAADWVEPPPAIDPLTGLTNRAAAVAAFDDALEWADTGYAAAVLVDLDRFRSVNDRFGIHTGDELLREIARRLIATLRGGESAARVGGDEFLITSATQSALTDLEALTARVEGCFTDPFTVGDKSIRVDASIGSSSLPAETATSDDLLRDVDLALLEAKRRPGTASAVCTDEIRQHSFERLEIESELRSAFEADELDIWVQPIVDARTHEVMLGEVLLRWQRDGNAIGPGAFIPIAEVIDMIIPLTRFALDRVCATAAAWHRAGIDIPLAVNVSATHMLDGRLAADVRDALDRYDTPAELLEIEVTETRLIEHFDRVEPEFAALREIGCQIAIDDFGSGYSSVRYLQRIPADLVKLDGEIVQDLVAAEPKTEALLGFITDLSHSLGFRVVAEGVETDDQLAAVVAAGVDLAQGYRFKAAMPIADFESDVLGITSSTGSTG